MGYNRAGTRRKQKLQETKKLAEQRAKKQAAQDRVVTLRRQHQAERLGHLLAQLQALASRSTASAGHLRQVARIDPVLGSDVARQQTLVPMHSFPIAHDISSESAHDRRAA